jgi:hypothetical protein
MDAAMEYAINAQPPQLTDLFRDVYDDHEPAPEPLRNRLERILATKLTANN